VAREGFLKDKYGPRAKKFEHYRHRGLKNYILYCLESLCPLNGFACLFDKIDHVVTITKEFT